MRNAEKKKSDYIITSLSTGGPYFGKWRESRIDFNRLAM